jgi:hypothetical protein
MVRSLLGAALSLSLAACGAPPQLAALPPVDPAQAATPPSASTDPDAASGGEPARHRPRPLAIHSSCTEVVTLVFGDDPRAAGAGKRTLGPSGSVDGPRDPQGKQTVWLLDDKGEPLVKVSVTRGMKTVEVGRSCRTLAAQ